MRWIPYVMVRIVAIFTVGVLIGINLPSLVSQYEATVYLTVFAFSYYVLRLVLRRSPPVRLASGGVGLTIILIAGYLSVLVRDESRHPDSLMQNSSQVLGYRVKLISTTEEKENSWRRIGQILAIRTPDGWKPCDGKLNLYWPKTEAVSELDYGDILVVNDNPQRVAGPQNPNEFDYRRFLAYRNIFHQHYLRQGGWMLVEKSTDRGPAYYAAQARVWTTSVINRYVQGSREQAIVNAFVIGVTDRIDDELKQAYAAGGAMHALAVSGLHVSILYGVLLFLLRPLERKRGGPWTIAVLSLVVLWMYAFVTGLSPSVLRAVAMFSFVAIAKPIGRATSIINTLAASAFFLLLYDPFLILSVGFQLSYLAVLGIVLLYRPIYNLLEPSWAWVNWLWQITCVSIAAQLATLAVTLYYFHQFPVYSLLANLFVIPASSIILLGGILLLIISPVAWLASWLGTALHILVYLLNEGLFRIEQFPFSSITPITLTPLQAYCIGACLVIIYLLLKTRRFIWTFMLVMLASAFSLADWVKAYDVAPPRFAVYRIASHSALEWSYGQHAYCLADSALQGDPDKVRFHILPNRISNRVDKVFEAWPVGKRGMEFYRFHGRDFLWIHDKSFVVPTKLETDYLIVGRNAVNSLESLTQTINFNYLIFDSSNSLRYCEQLKAEAAKLNKPCFSVLTDGAYILKL